MDARAERSFERNEVIKLYERDQYATFVKSDEVALLETAGFVIAERRTARRGMVQTIVGRRDEAISGAPRHEW